MRRFKALRAISLASVFSFAVFGCATGRNRSAGADFGLTAEAVSDGLLLTFDNIPADAVRLFIVVQSWIDAANPERERGITASFADIRDASFSAGDLHSVKLDRVKETGTVIFPIVQAGQKYLVSAAVETRADIENGIYPVFVEAEVVAEGGVYFNRNDVSLELHSNYAVTLSALPSFSPEVAFYTQRFSFAVTITVGETGSIGVGTHHIPAGLSFDGLTWMFEPQMSDSLRINGGGWLQAGNYYSARVTAYANILHDDILWSVEIAKTPEFDFSL